MGKLTRNLDLRELACRHCGLARPHPYLVVGLQLMVDQTPGCTGIVVTSGTRCVVHNLAEGGSPSSKHLPRPEHDGYSLAADVRLLGVSLLETLYAALSVDEFRAGGVGYYPDEGFVHADCRLGRARWGYVGGEMVSLEAALSSHRRT